MNLLNLFEDNNQPGSNYAEQLADQIFKVEPDLDATGTADEVLDYAFDLAVHDLGRKRARALFAYDEDFDSDLVSAYAHLQRQGVAEGEVYDLEKEYGYEKPKAQPKRASVPPTRPSLHPDDTDFMDPVERRLRADQERVKAAWAAHNAKKGVEESKMSEIDAEYQDYKKLSPREFYNMYKMTKQQWLAKYKNMLPQQGVVEADKKKDEPEPEVRDVALKRAISRAKADFPTAGTGIEALAKGFMRSQDEDQKSFDQIRQAERQQDQMLSQIAKIDQEQEQEIQDLEQQNSTLASRLQQLQSVNSELEKKLAAMSGHKVEKKSKTDSVPVASPGASTVNVKVPTVKTKSKNKPAPQKSAMKATAAQLAAPKVDPLAAMSQRITQGDQSIADKVTGQKSLAFEPSDNVLEPTIPQRQLNPKFAAARRDAEDARYSQMVKDLAGNPEGLRTAMGLSETDDEQEADYSDKYQDMVARVGQKAREQEKAKPVDIADLARKLAAIDASRKEK